MPGIADPGIVKRFLAWAPSASPEDRAKAVSALARAYLHGDLGAALRAEALVALSATLDDASAQVRRALAEALASSADAPRHVVVALANDQSEIACVVLARSPALRDAELVDCAATGDAPAQTAIARRPRLGPPVAAALAEVGERGAVIAMLGNFDTEMPVSIFRRILDRFRDDAAAREALLGRPELPAAMRAEIATATADALARFAAGHDWLNTGRAARIARDSREQTLIEIARTCSVEELEELVASLRERGALTVALLMRALMSGEMELPRQSLVDMSGVPARRVVAFMCDCRGAGFASLYAKAGLPAAYLPAFQAALRVVTTTRIETSGAISHELTTRTIRACEELADPELEPILAMLWRFAGEGARENARQVARETVASERATRLRNIELDADENRHLLNPESANENVAPPTQLEDAPPEIADAA